MHRTALKALVALGLAAAATVLLATPAGARFLLVTIEDHSAPLQKEQAAQAQAIVVLGGRRERVHEAARLHSLTGLPILLSGKGTGDRPYASEAEKMAAILRTQHGIEPRWVETRSVNTHENAVESWCLLAPQGLVRVVLVTQARHMVRARREFQAAGFDVLADPVPEPLVRPPLAAGDFVPGPAGWASVLRALEEYRDLLFGMVEDLADGVPRCGTGAAP